MSTLIAGKDPAADKWDIAGVVVLALYVVAGVVYSAMLGGVVRFTDERDFLHLSYNLLNGIGYSLDNVHLTASRPPGYPFFLFVLESLGAGMVWFRVAQFFFLAATIVLVSMLAPGRRMFAGILIVTALVMACPAMFYLSGTLYSQPLSAVLFILALVLMLETPRGWGLDMLTGLVFGALILTVPTFLVTMFLALAIGWWLKIVRGRGALVIVLAAALPLLGWGARNAIYLHHLVPVATNSGVNFLAGNNANASALKGADSPAMVPYYNVAANQGMDEFQANTYYWHQALSWIEQHPANALGLYCEKVLNFFNFVNDYPDDRKREFPWLSQVVQALSYALLLGLVGWRLLDLRRFPLTPREKLFLLIYVLSAFTSAIFLTRIRLRMPFDYLLIAVIAIHISRYLQARVTATTRSKRPSTASPSLV